jgi:L-amino acid N-acyltransferase YncA
MYYTRRADFYDTDDICDLYAEVAEHYGLNEPALDWQSMADFLEDESRLTIVAICGDDIETVAGAITAHIEETYYGYNHCWIDGIIVHPEHVVSQPLLDQVESWARGYKCRYIQMAIDASWRTNCASMMLMERKGFDHTGYTMRKDING